MMRHKKKPKVVYEDGRYEKFIAVNKETLEKTCAITLSRGRVAIGPDVWRMTNKYDICEYPFKVLDMIEFRYYYNSIEPPSSFLSSEYDGIEEEATFKVMM